MAELEYITEANKPSKLKQIKIEAEKLGYLRSGSRINTILRYKLTKNFHPYEKNAAIYRGFITDKKGNTYDVAVCLTSANTPVFDTDGEGYAVYTGKSTSVNRCTVEIFGLHDGKDDATFEAHYRYYWDEKPTSSDFGDCKQMFNDMMGGVYLEDFFIRNQEKLSSDCIGKFDDIINGGETDVTSFAARTAAKTAAKKDAFWQGKIKVKNGFVWSVTDKGLEVSVFYRNECSEVSLVNAALAKIWEKELLHTFRRSNIKDLKGISGEGKFMRDKSFNGYRMNYDLFFNSKNNTFEYCNMTTAKLITTASPTYADVNTWTSSTRDGRIHICDHTGDTSPYIKALCTDILLHSPRIKKYSGVNYIGIPYRDILEFIDSVSRRIPETPVDPPKEESPTILKTDNQEQVVVKAANAKDYENMSIQELEKLRSNLAVKKSSFKKKGKDISEIETALLQVRAAITAKKEGKPVVANTKNTAEKNAPVTTNVATKVPTGIKISSEAKMKMQAWHTGIRGFNIDSAGEAKLKMNYWACIELGYAEEAAKIKAVADRKGYVLESINMNSLYESLSNYINR